MAALRIALVLERFEPRRGGTERYAAELARRLVARGHAVTVVAARADPAAIAGAAWTRIAVPPFPKAARVWAFARRAAAATATGFDVVHGLQKSLGHTVFQPHTGSHRASLAAARGSRRTALGRAWHAIEKALAPTQWVFAAIERRQYAQRPAPVFVAVSDLVRRQMLERHGVDARAIRLLPNPVDLDRFAPPAPEVRQAARARFGARDGARVALFAAAVPRLKGLRPLLRAFPANGTAALWLAGEGVALACTGGAVRVLGHVADMAAVYAAADALVLPAFYDPAPLTVLEALAAGLPVLTSAACGHADLVRESGGVVVADPWDTQALRLGIDAVLAGPRPTAEFRAALAARHGWDAHLAALEAIYGEARAGRGRLASPVKEE